MCAYWLAPQSRFSKVNMPNETGFRQTNKLRFTYTTAKIESAGIFELIDFLKWILLLAQNCTKKSLFYLTELEIYKYKLIPSVQIVLCVLNYLWELKSVRWTNMQWFKFGYVDVILVKKLTIQHFYSSMRFDVINILTIGHIITSVIEWFGRMQRL